jgi:hypothetical protein
VSLHLITFNVTYLHKRCFSVVWAGTSAILYIYHQMWFPAPIRVSSQKKKWRRCTDEACRSFNYSNGSVLVSACLVGNLGIGKTFHCYLLFTIPKGGFWLLAQFNESSNSSWCKKGSTRWSLVRTIGERYWIYSNLWQVFNNSSSTETKGNIALVWSIW